MPLITQQFTRVIRKGESSYWTNKQRFVNTAAMLPDEVVIEFNLHQLLAAQNLATKHGAKLVVKNAEKKK